MKILCISTEGDYGTTLGKWYGSDEEHDNERCYMLMNNDDNISDICYRKNFLTINEYRNNLIDEILK